MKVILSADEIAAAVCEYLHKRGKQPRNNTLHFHIDIERGVGGLHATGEVDACLPAVVDYTATMNPIHLTKKEQA